MFIKKIIFGLGFLISYYIVAYVEYVVVFLSITP